MENMLYDEGFEWLEGQRWSLMKDIPWDQIDRSKMTQKDLDCLVTNALAEFTALDATIMFLRDFHTDIDFSCFMSVWFYEEMKHHLVLKKYLQAFGVEVPHSRMQMLHQELPPGGMINTLTMHMLGEIKLHNWYVAAYKRYEEPVIKQIFKHLAADELRHGKMYFRYLARKIGEDPAIAGQVLRMARFIIKEEGGTAKHPVPQLVKGDDSFNFADELGAVFAYIGMDEAMAKSEQMGFLWLAKLTGHAIHDEASLADAIREERRRGATMQRPTMQEALPALGVFG